MPRPSLGIADATAPSTEAAHHLAPWQLSVEKKRSEKGKITTLMEKNQTLQGTED